MCGDRRNRKKTPYATICLQTDSRRQLQPCHQKASQRWQPSSSCTHLSTYRDVNLQARMRRLWPVSDFLSHSAKYVKNKHVALFCMVNMPAFDTEEQKEHFFPLHFGSYKLCWPAPTDLYANASFLPARLPEKIPQGNGRAPACGSCAATTPETWLPLQTLCSHDH